MKYILIDRTTFEISVAEKPRPSFLTIPANHPSRKLLLRNRLASIVYFDVLYPSVWREDRRRGIDNVEYCLVEPDPYVIALAAIMWEGIVQGLSYDLIKTFVLSGLQRLKAAGSSIWIRSC